jgi:hypothetical protein
VTLSALLNQLVDLFLLPGDFLTSLPHTMAPDMFESGAERRVLAASLASGYWLVLSMTGYRIYGYCLRLFRHTRVRLASWINNVERFFRVRRIRASCAGGFFDLDQSPAETIQMEAIDVDDNSQQVLELARGLIDATAIDCRLVAEQLKISQHKARRICRELETLQFLKRMPDSEGVAGAYKLTPGGKLYVDITRPKQLIN